MVYRVRRQLVEEGLEAVLSRKAPTRPSVPRIFDGETEARLIALACSKPPEGHARWSLRLLESNRFPDALPSRRTTRPASPSYGQTQKLVVDGWTGRSAALSAYS